MPRRGGGPNLEKVRARRVGGPKFRFFFLPLLLPFSVFFSLWVSSRGILVVFEAPGPQMWTLGVLGLSCETPATSTMATIPREDPRERKKKAKMVWEREKTENFGGSGGGRSGGRRSGGERGPREACCFGIRAQRCSIRVFRPRTRQPVHSSVFLQLCRIWVLRTCPEVLSA